MGLAACSTPLKIPAQGPRRTSTRRWTALLSTLSEHACLLSEMISIGRCSSKTDAERDTELTQLNGKLYTVERALWEKSCPAVANGPVGSIVR